VSDEDIRAADFSDFRVKKREKVLSKWSIWEASPSPERQEDSAQEAAPQQQEPSETQAARSPEREDEKNSRKDIGVAEVDNDMGSQSDGETDSSEEERRRKRKRERKKRKKSEKKKKRKKEERRGSDDTKAGEDEAGPRMDSPASPGNEDKEQEEGDVKGKGMAVVDTTTVPIPTGEAGASGSVSMMQQNYMVAKEMGMDDDFVGPQPLPAVDGAAAAEGKVNYGGAMRPGEGELIAQFVQSGKRIPRRGEVGLEADEIMDFENLGYVMSGSRHARMNAIRIRKENQVYSAEEKKALAMINYEEKAKREQKVLTDLKKLVAKHLGDAET